MERRNPLVEKLRENSFIHNIWNIINLWSPLKPPFLETDARNNWLFHTKFNSQQLLFDTMGNFDSVEPPSESTFPVQYIITFQRWQSFEVPSSTLGEIEVCDHWLFCTKFNSQQLLFEQFFDIIGNFCSFQPESESTFPLLFGANRAPNMALCTAVRA